MGFNFKAFGTAFMDDQAKAIQKRVEKAEDYEDQQREQAERNKSIVGKRRALVNLAKTEINMLKKLGAKDKHIMQLLQQGQRLCLSFLSHYRKKHRRGPALVVRTHSARMS